MSTEDPATDPDTSLERLSRAAGRCVMSGIDGTRLDSIEDALAAGRLGGLILFRENLATLSEGAALIARARAIARHPLLVAADEEGGIVSQLDGLPVESGSSHRASGAPSPRSLGELDDPGFTETVYGALGALLRAVGFDVAFAPLLDVNVERMNPVIGSRSFGSTPERVTSHALAALRGFNAAGIVATGKHFPGHGAASADSHTSLPTIPGSREEITRRDLPPFVAAVREGIPLLMSAHVFAPGLDPVRQPATASRAILTGILREAIGFQGVVVSDALEMAGFSEGGSEGEPGGVARSLLAGVDLFLVARGVALAERVQEELLDAASRHEAVRNRLYEAAGRIDRLVRSAAAPGVRPLDRVVAESREVLDRAHDRALGVHAARALRPADGIVASSSVAWAFLQQDAIRAAFGCSPSDIGRYDDQGVDARWLEGRATIVQLLFARGHRVAPGDLAALETIEAWRCAVPGTRRALAVSLADGEILDRIPPEWERIKGTGSQAAALSAARRALGLGGEA